MRRDIIKARRGGLDYADLEARVLGGDINALRPLIRQASGPNTLDRRMADGQSSLNLGDGSRLEFTGYASTTNDPYEMQDWAGTYTEVVQGGAFAKTLGVPMGSWSQAPDVIFCLNHEWSAAPMARTIAGTLRLMEDSTGLAVEASLDAKRSDVYILQSAMEAGELDAMSFAFWTTRQLWSPDYEQRDILEVDMDGGDVSEVTWPANPGTNGTTGLRARAGRALLRTDVPKLLIARAREEHRAGKTLSAATAEVLQTVLDLIADADVNVDSAQVMLSELLGVPNPDDDAGETDSGESVDTEAKSGDSGTSPAMSLSLMRLLEDPAVRTAVPA